MLIHFAFGAKKDHPEEQANLAIQYILKEKRLKFSLDCYEFLPVLHYPGEGYVPKQDKTHFDESQNQLIFPPILTSGLQHSPDWIPITTRMVRYIPEKIPMICFINIPFNKLKATSHHENYGKFGIVFNNNFIKQYAPKPVHYYDESQLFCDCKILKWNELSKLNSKGMLTSEQQREYENLKKEILLYRKPATLWPSFGESKVFNINRTDLQLPAKMTLWQYDRYCQNYNFTKEHEWRISRENDTDNEFLYFREEDIFAIIVPNKKIEELVQEFLIRHYKNHPKIMLYPS